MKVRYRIVEEVTQNGNWDTPGCQINLICSWLRWRKRISCQRITPLRYFGKRI